MAAGAPRPPRLGVYDRLTATLCAPIDPTSLAAFRIAFGVLIAVDALSERSFVDANSLHGDNTQCTFALIDGLPIFSKTVFEMVVLAVSVGCVGLILGLFYRASIIVLAASYWYMFFLDKRVWNNHRSVSSSPGWCTGRSEARVATWRPPNAEARAIVYGLCSAVY